MIQRRPEAFVVKTGCRSTRPATLDMAHDLGKLDRFEVREPDCVEASIDAITICGV